MSQHSSLCRDIVSLCSDIAASMYVVWLVACVATFIFNIFNFSPFVFIATLLVYVATQFLLSEFFYIVTINLYVAT